MEILTDTHIQFMKYRKYWIAVSVVLVLLSCFAVSGKSIGAVLAKSLGGYVMVGLGYTHWIKDHHAVEVTVYPFAYPGEGFPVGVKAGYAWIPSIEVWRAKLGGNVTVLVHKPDGDRGRFTPLVAFTPGLQYDPTASRSVRMDLWMSYFLTEKVFAPTNLEVLYAWKK